LSEAYSRMADRLLIRLAIQVGKFIAAVVVAALP